MRRLRLLPLLGALVLACAAGVGAQPPVDRSPTWASLTPLQKQTLAPLQADWASIDTSRKQKWIELAARFPTMPAEERRRVQARMAEWARMSPAERAGARLQFQEARRLPAEERQARWQAYQALSPEEKQTLAQRAKPAARPSSSPDAPRQTADAASAASAKKRNLIATPRTASARVVAPTVVQARPGATTTTMSTRPSPPAHHQAGLPKIAATPAFVDPATLLPKRGPQGAAVHTEAPAEPAEQP